MRWDRWERVRDFQQRRVYRAEWLPRRVLGTYGEGKAWSESDLRALLRDFWRFVDDPVLPAPGLRINQRRKTWSFYMLEPHAIELAPSMQCPLILLHEATHARMRRELSEGAVAAHGPEFVTKLRQAVDRFLPFEVGQAYREGLRLNKVRRYVR